jgi:hypothetical protein
MNSGVSTRNWIFGNAQSGGSGNVGLQINVGSNAQVLIIKFLSNLDTISSVTFLLYSNKTTSISLFVYQCDFGDPAATPIVHGAAPVNLITTTLAQCPQTVTFTFASPITFTKNVCEVYVGNPNQTVSLGFWQMLVQ